MAELLFSHGLAKAKPVGLARLMGSTGNSPGSDA